MTISEMINELQAIQQKHGDIYVFDKEIYSVYGIRMVEVKKEDRQLIHECDFAVGDKFVQLMHGN